MESRVSSSANLGIPGHVGIIMDGNGRWAQQRGLSRSAGHKEGLAAAKRVVKAARDLGISYLTLYAFSTENWKRTQEEVGFLMDLLSIYLKKELDFYRQEQIRIVHSGNPAQLPAKVLKELAEVIRDTKDHGGLTVNLAINYGGRDEVSRAVERLVMKEFEVLLADGSTPVPPHLIRERLAEISHLLQEGRISRYLDQAESPEADLIIRSGGERRLSNFLLWQSSYAELVFVDSLWPDWDAECFNSAIQEYQRRQRRFGGL